MAPKQAHTEKPVQMDPREDGKELQGASGDAEPVPPESSSKDIAELKDMFQKFLLDQRDKFVRNKKIHDKKQDGSPCNISFTYCREK